MKVEHSLHILETIFKYQILWKSFEFQPRYSMRTGRRTYRHEKANSRFTQFCEHA